MFEVSEVQDVIYVDPPYHLRLQTIVDPWPGSMVHAVSVESWENLRTSATSTDAQRHDRESNN